MPRASRKGKNNGNAQQHEGGLPRSEQPTIVERGKKFAAYDKFGKLIILGYDRRIVQGYADEQKKL
jgi:hypothetical protein